LQSLKILERAKEIARANHKFSFLTLVISLEKKIETLHITRSMRNMGDKLSEEALEVSGRIDRVARLSNLALQMYSWYIKNGHARNEKDETGIKEFFKNNLPPNAYLLTDFYERLYLYQSYTWYAFIRQDFLMYYRYSQKWVNLFYEKPLMKRVDAGHYIKGLHNLLNAHFDLRNYAAFAPTLKEFEPFAETERVQKNDNFRIQSFLYIAQAKMNRHFLIGSFHEGLEFIPGIEEKLDEYELF